MNDMKKYIAFILFCISLVLSSCSSNGNSDDKEKEAKESKTEVLF